MLGRDLPTTARWWKPQSTELTVKTPISSSEVTKISECRNTLVRRCNGTTARLGYRNGLTTLPLGSESVTALSSWRMWTVWMINCLRYAGYHSDTALLEPLMCGSQVRIPVGEEGQTWLLTVTWKTTGSMLKHQPAQASSQLLMWCDPKQIHCFHS